MMTNQTVLTIAQEALQITVLVSAPLLLTALLVGLLVSVFQAATQINEMTLSFIPKLLAMFAVLIVSGPWILSMLVDYMQRLYTSIPQTIG
jgi:flagellar biosynthetic protein FliQ